MLLVYICICLKKQFRLHFTII
uniref:Uncharacterized protein n=1 Tax=Arundo donax TaxID=35708 RepID=A0A0A8Z8R9_ARUDO